MPNNPIRLKKIYEHDMDLLILEEFISDKRFAQLFLDKVNLTDDYILHTAAHSVADEDGETDIMFILQYPDRKVALMIEDKIDAVTMENQSGRYHIRADKGMKRGEFQDYKIFLVAPADYIEEHKDDPNASYENVVEYEQMLEYFNRKDDPRSKWKSAVIAFALQEKKTGYIVREACMVTEFWRRLRELCEKEYPQLEMVGADAPKGLQARWPEFRTSLRKVKVIYKSDRGIIDLEFLAYGDRTNELMQRIGSVKTEEMRIRPTGKSASVRLERKNCIVDFNDEFEPQIGKLKVCLDAVCELCELTNAFNENDFY